MPRRNVKKTDKLARRSQNMKLRNIALGGALVLLSVPAWASTYYGGFEDTVGGDYDFNDIVFQIPGATLITNTGSYFGDTAAALLASNDSGSPFWNHTSSDADPAHDNIGYCVYGDAADPGACGGNGPFSVQASYLAAKADGKSSVNDVSSFRPLRPGRGADSGDNHRRQ
jgi:hypothetical protein